MAESDEEDQKPSKKLYAKKAQDDQQQIKLFNINLEEMEEIDNKDDSNMLKEYLPKKFDK